MKIINNQDELIDQLAVRAHFTKGDVKTILLKLTEVMEDLVFESSPFEPGETSRILLKSRGLGTLIIQKIPPRKGNKGEDLPETTKILFKLAENIRRAGKDFHEIDNENTLDEE